jgi:hypothetical protein
MTRCSALEKCDKQVTAMVYCTPNTRKHNVLQSSFAHLRLGMLRILPAEYPLLSSNKLTYIPSGQGEPRYPKTQLVDRQLLYGTLIERHHSTTINCLLCLPVSTFLSDVPLPTVKEIRSPGSFPDGHRMLNFLPSIEISKSCPGIVPMGTSASNSPVGEEREHRECGALPLGDG